jgi:hypothetical protein
VTPIEQAIKNLQDALLVTSEIEKRHSASIKDHEQAIDDLYKVYSAHNKMLSAMSQAALNQIETQETVARLNTESAKLRRESEVFRQRTEQNLSEITGKLDGLLGYVAGLPPRPPEAR